MTSLTRVEIVELISRIQFGGAGCGTYQALERATGNADVWYIFDALELEGMLPDKIFDLFFSGNGIHGKAR